jgi:pyruvate, orthophosphate dikinase
MKARPALKPPEMRSPETIKALAGRGEHNFADLGRITQLYQNYRTGIDTETLPEEWLNPCEAASAVREAGIYNRLHGQLNERWRDVKKHIALEAQGRGGYAEGLVAQSRDEAKDLMKKGKPLIYVARSLSAPDLPYLKAAAGVVLIYDDRKEVSDRHLFLDVLSHPCFVMVSAKAEANMRSAYNSMPLKSGELCSLFASHGIVAHGSMPHTEPDLNAPEFKAMIDLFRDPKLTAYSPFKIGVIVNNLTDVKKALACGADSISPVRSEFFLSEAGSAALLTAVTSQDVPERVAAIGRLEADMREQYGALFREAATARVPVSIRLLDAPLHKLLHRDRHDMEGIGEDMPGLSQEQLNRACDRHGIRLGLEVPELYQAQIRAIADAHKASPDVRLDICIPFLAAPEEMKAFNKRVLEPLGYSLSQKEPFAISTMIETPSAAIGADQLAALTTKGLIGSGDLKRTVFADPAANYHEQFIQATHEGMHPILTRAVEMGLDGFKDTQNALIWHGPANHFTVNAVQKLNPCPDTMVVAPDQVPFARLHAIQIGMENAVRAEKQKQESKGL